MERFDVVVIGAGPAGYMAAIRAAQMGLRTACVDAKVNKKGGFALGGACVHDGCIPAKSLLHSTDLYEKITSKAAAHGITVGKVELDVSAMVARKDAVVNRIAKGIGSLFDKYGVTRFKGKGRILPGIKVEVTSEHSGGDNVLLKAKDIIVASGATSMHPRIFPIDGEYIVDAPQAFDFEAIPKTIAVIGAGVIGLEVAEIWRRLGTKVVLFDALDRPLGFLDDDLHRAVLREFTKQGLEMELGTRVTSAEVKDGGVQIVCQGEGKPQRLSFEKVIVAVGRRPSTEDLFAPEMELLLDEGGFLQVNAKCRTNIPHIYAVGDVAGGPMLAHKGTAEGMMVAERLAGRDSDVHYEAIPWVIYTRPEIAWVGKSEKQLRAAAIDYRVSVFPLSANGRAMVMEENVGMVKILADAETDRILGVQMFAAHASEMIAEAVVAMEFGACAEDLAHTIHAHPTVSESVREAALGVGGRMLLM